MFRLVPQKTRSGHRNTSVALDNNNCTPVRNIGRPFARESKLSRIVWVNTKAKLQQTGSRKSTEWDWTNNGWIICRNVPIDFERWHCDKIERVECKWREREREGEDAMLLISTSVQRNLLALRSELIQMILILAIFLVNEQENMLIESWERERERRNLNWGKK